MIESALNSIIKKSAEAIKPEQGDYTSDGLLICGKCNSPKQCKISVFGEEKTVSCLCKCEVEKRDREEAERKRIEMKNRIVIMRHEGFPQSDMADWTFENDDGVDEKTITVMKNYVENFDKMRDNGKGMLLYGNVGTGKTYAAACVANALIDKGIPCLMTNFARIANTVQGMFDGKQAYYDSLNKYPMLVIDDLSAERKTEYMQEIVFNVIDARYRSGLPLIVTTNLTSDEIKRPAEMTNKRTFSRLLEMCLPLEVKGVDRRRDKLKLTYDEYKNILGL